MRAVIVVRTEAERTRLFSNIRRVVINFTLFFDENLVMHPQLREFLKKAVNWRIKVIFVSLDLSDVQMKEICEQLGLSQSFASFLGKNFLRRKNWLKTILLNDESRVEQTATLFLINDQNLSEKLMKEGCQVVVFEDSSMIGHGLKKKENVVTCGGWHDVDILEIVT